MSIDEQIAVMKAYSEGKTIQSRVKDRFGDEWTDVPDPHWNFGEWDYRVKPENEGTKAERMTNRQLAELMAKGYGEWIGGPVRLPCTMYSYPLSREGSDVDDDMRVRPWGSAEWTIPTVDIYNDFCHPKCREDKGEEDA